MRAEKKLQTRQALLDAALLLMESGRGFSGLSLREVTREVGIVPTAFYRHFPDMERLGLALVEEVSSSFREAIRLVRSNQFEHLGAISASVQIFVDYVVAHRQLFLFLAREQYGGSTVIRQAIKEIQQRFIADLVDDLKQMPKQRHLNLDDLDVLADLIVKTVFSTLPELINPLDLESHSQELAQDRLESKLRFIFMGAKYWRGVQWEPND
ncbi:TetR family transcriptional regulator [Chitinimonas sp. BJB300]|uniref:TetR family transcriptional regulator n=1 Tax=Chitinimonas sp. BJB300 TaxID=1559339 RepID=UPI0018EC9816|nr:TetR family transcriptional regulator [Chitinimonas sp. BJB300]